MSSRSCSPGYPEPKSHHGNSSSRDGNESPPQLPDSTHTSRPRPRSPDSSSRHSKWQGPSRKSSDHSTYSKSSRKHSKRSHSRSKSPHRRRESSTSRRSRSRSKSPGTRQDYSSSARKSRSRSRSESPPHNRRTHSRKSRSRSPPIQKKRVYSRSYQRSRSRSKSPSHTRRDYSGSARHSRSRSKSPVYSKRGTQDYKPHRFSGNRRGGYSFRGRETAKYFRTSATPIAKLPSECNATTPTSNKPAVPSAPLPPLEDLATLTPEQKLERALQAAQALNPKLSTPQPSISALSSTSASVATCMNTLSNNPVALQKKKLLWNKKSSENKWEGVSFGEEGDDEAQAKFRRLMGMGKTASSKATSQAVPSDGSKMKEKHDKLRKDLEQQYEASRFMTHLARGSGLGYGFAHETSGDSTTQ